MNDDPMKKAEEIALLLLGVIALALLMLVAFVLAHWR
jgi:hypothetical protein